MVLLQTLDHLWREHLVTLEHLRQVIGFRAYGQRDPLNEYKSEAFVLFEAMLADLREAVTGQLMHVELAPPESSRLQPVELPQMEAHHIDPFTGLDELAMADAAIAGERRAPVRPAPERRAPLQTRKARGRRSERARHVGQRLAQRAVPVRLGQEVQALPRQARLEDQRPEEADSPKRSNPLLKKSRLSAYFREELQRNDACVRFISDSKRS